MFQNCIQLILRGPAVTFGAATNKAQAPECYSCEINLLFGDIDSVNRSRMRNHRVDVREFRADCDRAGTFLCSESTIFNQLFTMQVVELRVAEFNSEFSQGVVL